MQVPGVPKGLVFGQNVGVPGQDQLVKYTQKALHDFLTSVETLPEDKLDWAPSHTARSAFSMAQEIAMTCEFFAYFLQHRKMPLGDPHDGVAGAKLRLRTIGDCRSAAEVGTARIIQLISDFPDEEMETEIALPFLNGRVMTMADVLGLYAWNLVYHYGQVNYIQTILGDMVMH